MWLWGIFIFKLPVLFKNTLKFFENKNNDTDDSEGCLLNKENDPAKIFNL